MSATLSVGISSDEAVGPGWSAAEPRVRAYLGAAGLEDSMAKALAREIIAGCAADRPQLAEDEAILAGLRLARRLLTDKSPRDRELANRVSLAPRDQPLSIRRRAFRSVMDWRLAAAPVWAPPPAPTPPAGPTPPARPPSGRRHRGQRQPPLPARPHPPGNLHLADPHHGDLGGGELRRDPRRR